MLPDRAQQPRPYMEVYEGRVAPVLTLDPSTPLLDAYAAFYIRINKGDSAVEQALVQLQSASQDSVISSPENRLETWLKRVRIAGLRSMETDVEYFKAENNDMDIQSIIDSYFNVKALNSVLLTYVPRNDVAIDVLNDLVSDIARGCTNNVPDRHVTESPSAATSAIAAIAAISASAALYIDIPQSLKTYVEWSIRSARFLNELESLHRSGFDALSTAKIRNDLLQLYYCQEQTDSKGLTWKEVSMLRSNVCDAQGNGVNNLNVTPDGLLQTTKLCCTFMKCRTRLFPDIYTLKSIKKAFASNSLSLDSCTKAPIACIARIQVCNLPTTPTIRAWAIPNIYSIMDPELRFMLLYACYDVELENGTVLTLYAPRFEDQSEPFLLDLFKKSSRTLSAVRVHLHSDILYTSDHVDVSHVECFFPDISLTYVKDAGVFVQRLCHALGDSVQTRFDRWKERRQALRGQYRSIKECVHVFDGGVWRPTCMQSDFTLAYKMMTFVRLTSNELIVRTINSIFSAFCQQFFTWELDTCPASVNVPPRVYNDIYMSVKANETGTVGVEENTLQQEHRLFFSEAANRSIIAAKFFIKTSGDFFKVIFPKHFQPPSRLFYADCTVGFRTNATPVVLRPSCVAAFSENQDEPVHMYVRTQRHWRKVSTVVATRVPGLDDNIRRFTLHSEALDMGHIIRSKQAKGYATVLLYHVRV